MLFSGEITLLKCLSSTVLNNEPDWALTLLPKHLFTPMMSSTEMGNDFIPWGVLASQTSLNPPTHAQCYRIPLFLLL